MNAIVPLNIAALRVNANDNSNVVGHFQGRTAAFDHLPWKNDAPGASTGDTIVRSLDDRSSALEPLGVGVHLHWALPEYFRRGVQQGDGKVVFPPAPNRWLIVRYLSTFNAQTAAYAPATTTSFIVESDYLSDHLTSDPWGFKRPSVSVPVPFQHSDGTQQPYMWMGRVLDFASWNPSAEIAGDFLPAKQGADGKPLYLNAHGFAGPGFSAYYPDCCSVFGFWDHFADLSDLHAGIADNKARFKVTYQVIGWVNEGDALASIESDVDTEFNDYTRRCKEKGVEVERTRSSFFHAIAEDKYRWSFQPVEAGNFPHAMIVAGTMQEIVWRMDEPNSFFLSNPQASQPPPDPGAAKWGDAVKVAVGNTTPEALSALLKYDLLRSGDLSWSTDKSYAKGDLAALGDDSYRSLQDNNAGRPPDQNPDFWEPHGEVLTSYEYLLDALQLGLLNDLEVRDNKIVTLDEALHSRAFSKRDGGLLWFIREQPQPGVAEQPVDTGQEVALSLALAEQLSLLNRAQKEYDQGRAALSAARVQLFMDWFRWIKLNFVNLTSPETNLLNNLTNFIGTPGDGDSELGAVVARGAKTGILQYDADADTGKTLLREPSDLQKKSAGWDTSLANAVWTQYQAVLKAIPATANRELEAVPAPAFFLPTDPVLLVEGSKTEPARRNGTTRQIAVRVSSELVSAITVHSSGSEFTLAASALSGFPSAVAQGKGSVFAGIAEDVQALVREAKLLTPMLAAEVASALAAQGGANNPASAGLDTFMTALRKEQGGMSPLDSDQQGGLFAAIRQSGFQQAADPTSAETPLKPKFTGWAPSPIAWNSQQAMQEFSATRLDPFLPVFLIWSVSFRPLVQDGAGGYAPGNVTTHFELNEDEVDYRYKTPGSAPFTPSTEFIAYSGSAVLSGTAANILNDQIRTYARNYPDDPARPTLLNIQHHYAGRKILSQALSGFNVGQTLRAYIPRIALDNLCMSNGEDPLTPLIDTAARANPLDNWYDFAFNSQAPVATGLLSQNFGPLRSGFMQVTKLCIVDVFGQQMDLTTDGTQINAIEALSLQPRSDDSANRGMIFLPPRLEAPSRLWVRWLSAAHDTNVAGDFVEMNEHPATSPICGWMLPNHLDNSLFFYDVSGAAIGSLGLEHGQQVYRTRPGNQANSADSLSADIGAPQSPTVNPHLSAFMWYVDGKKNDPAFLEALMTAINNSDMFINPANFSEDANLSLFIGRPLAIARAVLSMETSGGVLPLSQKDEQFNEDINTAGRFDYAERQKAGSADLGNVLFPVRLGNLPHLDDGLVGYLIEQEGDSPYSTFYSAAAPEHSASSAVTQPAADNIVLTLNAPPKFLTFLLDPRAGIHATTGVLPVAQLDIPPDHYTQTMRSLAMTFFTHPVLSKRQGLVVPVPQEGGYDWSWLTPGATGGAAASPLKAVAANDAAIYDYTPQSLLEGWLRLDHTDTETLKEDVK